MISSVMEKSKTALPTPHIRRDLRCGGGKESSFVGNGTILLVRPIRIWSEAVQRLCWYCQSISNDRDRKGCEGHKGVHLANGEGRYANAPSFELWD